MSWDGSEFAWFPPNVEMRPPATIKFTTIATEINNGLIGLRVTLLILRSVSEAIVGAEDEPDNANSDSGLSGNKDWWRRPQVLHP